MELIHCPIGKELFAALQLSGGTDTIYQTYNGEVNVLTIQVNPTWDAYRAHRETCDICGMKP